MFIKLSGHDVDGVKRAHKLTTQSGQIFWCDMRKVGAHVKESGQNCWWCDVRLMSAYVDKKEGKWATMWLVWCALSGRTCFDKKEGKWAELLMVWCALSGRSCQWHKVGNNVVSVMHVKWAHMLMNRKESGQNYWWCDLCKLSACMGKKEVGRNVDGVICVKWALMLMKTSGHWARCQWPEEVGNIQWVLNVGGVMCVLWVNMLMLITLVGTVSVWARTIDAWTFLKQRQVSKDVIWEDVN